MTKPVIAIVEDDTDIAELMRFAVEQQGYTVKLFSTLVSVEAFVVKHKPFSIFMDLSIKGGESTSLIKKLKRNRSTASIPIVLISARNALGTIAKNVGADYFLTKPFELKELLKFVPPRTRSKS